MFRECVFCSHSLCYYSRSAHCITCWKCRMVAIARNRSERKKLRRRRRKRTEEKNRISTMCAANRGKLTPNVFESKGAKPKESEKKRTIFPKRMQWHRPNTWNLSDAHTHHINKNRLIHWMRFCHSFLMHDVKLCMTEKQNKPKPANRLTRNWQIQK